MKIIAPEFGTFKINPYLCNVKYKFDYPVNILLNAA